MTEYLNKLQKRYNVLDWTYIDTNPFIMPDGKVYFVQVTTDIESLFMNGGGNIVCIYDLKRKDGKVRGTIIDKKYIKDL
jgi:hypothetical protein